MNTQRPDGKLLSIFSLLLVLSVTAGVAAGAAQDDKDTAQDGTAEAQDGRQADCDWKCQEKRRRGDRAGSDDLEDLVKPRKRPGEIWVGSPEVFTRERLVNDQLVQDTWLRKQLEESDKVEFGNQGLVDTRTLFGLSNRTGVEADPNLLGIYNAESNATRADIQRRQRQAELDDQVNTLQKLKNIRALQAELRGETPEPVDAALPTTDGDDSGGGDGGGTTPEAPSPSGGTGDGPTPPSTGIGKSTDFVERLSNADRANLLPDPSDIQKTDANQSPIDIFRDRLAYREEIRNEIFENALDDRHDLRGNTAYRLNFDATILPKAKTDAWAVVEMSVRKAQDRVPDKNSEARKIACQEALAKTAVESYDGIPTGAYLHHELVCNRDRDVLKLGSFWDQAFEAQTILACLRDAKPTGRRPLCLDGYPQVPWPEESNSWEQRLAERTDKLHDLLAEVAGDEDYRSMDRLMPRWEIEEIVRLAPEVEEERCRLQRDKTIRACALARAADPASEMLKYHHQWKADLADDLNLLLVERWAYYDRCLCNSKNDQRCFAPGMEEPNGECLVNHSLGHEIGAYAQTQLGVELLEERETGIEIHGVSDWRKNDAWRATELEGADLSGVLTAELSSFVDELAAVYGSRSEFEESRSTRLNFSYYDGEPAWEDARRVVTVERKGGARSSLDGPLENLTVQQVRKLVEAVERVGLLGSEEYYELNNVEYRVCRASDLALDELHQGVAIEAPEDLFDFDLGVSDGWYSLLGASEILPLGDRQEIMVGGRAIEIAKPNRDGVVIYSDATITFDPDRVPGPFKKLAETIGSVDPNGGPLKDEKGRPKESIPVDVSSRGKTVDIDVSPRDSGLRSMSEFEIARETWLRAIRQTAKSCNGNERKALRMLLHGHMRWRLNKLGLVDYAVVEDPWPLRDDKDQNLAPCDAKRVEVRCVDDDSSCEPADETERFQRFRNDLEKHTRTYAYAATPKETVQRISEVAAHRSSFELTAMVSALTRGAKIDNVSEMVLESQRLLHGISRKPLVVGFTHGLHFGDGEGGRAREAHAGWLIGPKFKLRQSRLPIPFTRGYRYAHTPIQNNLSAVVSVPGWWKEAEVGVTTYWRSTGNKRKGEVRRHRHRIKLPGTTGAITDALLAERSPDVAKPATYAVTHGKPAQILIDGRNLWRSTRVTLGNQIADSYTVLPALAGLVATFDKVKEPTSPDGKARSGVEVYVWTSTGRRLAGEATVHPAKKVEKVDPKLRLDPPYFVQGGTGIAGKVTLKVAAGELSKATQLEIHVRPVEPDGRYGEPVILPDVTFDAAKKTYTAAVSQGDFSKLMAPTLVRAILVLTPEAKGKVESVSAEANGVYFPKTPEIAASLTSADGMLTLGTEKWTSVAFPSFSATTAIELTHSGPAKVRAVRLASAEWKPVAEGRLELKAKLVIDYVAAANTLSKGQTVQINVALEDDELKRAFELSGLPLTFTQP